jgi:hypothetical protein
MLTKKRIIIQLAGKYLLEITIQDALCNAWKQQKHSSLTDDMATLELRKGPLLHPTNIKLKSTPPTIQYKNMKFHQVQANIHGTC